MPTFTIRRTKGGKTHFAAAVLADTVARLTADPAEAKRLTRAEADAVMGKLAAKRAPGGWDVLDADGRQVAGFCFDADADVLAKTAEHAGQESPAQPAPSLCEHMTLAAVGDDSPFRELHALLGLTTPPDATSLKDVAAVALQQIKDLYELRADDELKGDETALVPA